MFFEWINKNLIWGSINLWNKGQKEFGIKKNMRVERVYFVIMCLNFKWEGSKFFERTSRNFLIGD